MFQQIDFNIRYQLYQIPTKLMTYHVLFWTVINNYLRCCKEKITHIFVSNNTCNDGVSLEYKDDFFNLFRLQIIILLYKLLGIMIMIYIYIYIYIYILHKQVKA